MLNSVSASVSTPALAPLLLPRPRATPLQESLCRVTHRPVELVRERAGIGGMGAAHGTLRSRRCTVHAIGADRAHEASRARRSPVRSTPADPAPEPEPTGAESAVPSATERPQRTDADWRQAQAKLAAIVSTLASGVAALLRDAPEETAVEDFEMPPLISTEALRAQLEQTRAAILLLPADHPARQLLADLQSSTQPSQPWRLIAWLAPALPEQQRILRQQEQVSQFCERAAALLQACASQQTPLAQAALTTISDLLAMLQACVERQEQDLRPLIAAAEDAGLDRKDQLDDLLQDSVDQVIELVVSLAAGAVDDAFDANACAALLAPWFAQLQEIDCLADRIVELRFALKAVIDMLMQACPIAQVELLEDARTLWLDGQDRQEEQRLRRNQHLQTLGTLVQLHADTAGYPLRLRAAAQSQRDWKAEKTSFENQWHYEHDPLTRNEKAEQDQVALARQLKDAWLRGGNPDGFTKAELRDAFDLADAMADFAAGARQTAQMQKVIVPQEVMARRVLSLKQSWAAWSEVDGVAPIANAPLQIAGSAEATPQLPYGQLPGWLQDIADSSRQALESVTDAVTSASNILLPAAAGGLAARWVTRNSPVLPSSAFNALGAGLYIAASQLAPQGQASLVCPPGTEPDRRRDRVPDRAELVERSRAVLENLKAGAVRPAPVVHDSWQQMQETGKLFLPQADKALVLEHVRDRGHGRFDLTYRGESGQKLVKVTPEIIGRMVSLEASRHRRMGSGIGNIGDGVNAGVHAGGVRAVGHAMGRGLSTLSGIGQYGANGFEMMQFAEMGGRAMVGNLTAGDAGPFIGFWETMSDYSHGLNKLLIGRATTPDLILMKKTSSALGKFLSAGDVVAGVADNLRLWGQLAFGNPTPAQEYQYRMQLAVNSVAMGLSIGAMSFPSLAPLAFMAQVLCYLPTKLGEHRALSDKAVHSAGLLLQRWKDHSKPLISFDPQSGTGNVTLLCASEIYPLRSVRIGPDHLTYKPNTVVVYRGGTQEGWAALGPAIHWAAGKVAIPPPAPFRTVGTTMAKEVLRPNRHRPLAWYTGIEQKTHHVHYDANAPLMFKLRLTPALEMFYKQSSALLHGTRQDAELLAWERSPFAHKFPIRTDDQLMEEFEHAGLPSVIDFTVTRHPFTGLIMLPPLDMRHRKLVTGNLSSEVEDRDHRTFVFLSPEMKDLVLHSLAGGGFALSLTPDFKGIGDGNAMLELVQDPRDPRTLMIRLEHVTPTRSEAETQFIEFYKYINPERYRWGDRLKINGISAEDFIRGAFKGPSRNSGPRRDSLYDTLIHHRSANPAKWGLHIEMPDFSDGDPFFLGRQLTGSASEHERQLLADLGGMAKFFFDVHDLRLEFPVRINERSASHHIDLVYDDVRVPLSWDADTQALKIGRPVAWGVLPAYNYLRPARSDGVETIPAHRQITPPDGYELADHGDAPPLAGLVLSRMRGNQTELFFQEPGAAPRPLSQQQYADFLTARPLALDYGAISGRIIPGLRDHIGEDISAHMSRLDPDGVFHMRSAPPLTDPVNFQKAMLAAKGGRASTLEIFRQYGLHAGSPSVAHPPLTAGQLDRARAIIRKAERMVEAYVLSGTRQTHVTIGQPPVQATLQFSLPAGEFYPVVDTIILPAGKRPQADELHQIATQNRHLRLAQRVLVRWTEGLAFFDTLSRQLSFMPQQQSRGLEPAGRDRQYEYFTLAGQPDSLVRWLPSRPTIERTEEAFRLDPSTVSPVETLLPTGFIGALGLGAGSWQFEPMRGALWRTELAELSLVRLGEWQLRSANGAADRFYVVTPAGGRDASTSQRAQLRAYLNKQVLQALDAEVAAMQEQGANGPGGAQRNLIGARYHQEIRLPEWALAKLPAPLKNLPAPATLAEMLAVFGIAASDYPGFGQLRVGALAPMMDDYAALADQAVLTKPVRNAQGQTESHRYQMKGDFYKRVRIDSPDAFADIMRLVAAYPRAPIDSALRQFCAGTAPQRCVTQTADNHFVVHGAKWQLLGRQAGKLLYGRTKDGRYQVKAHTPLPASSAALAQLVAGTRSSPSQVWYSISESLHRELDAAEISLEMLLTHEQQPSGLLLARTAQGVTCLQLPAPGEASMPPLWTELDQACHTGHLEYRGRTASGAHRLQHSSGKLLLIQDGTSRPIASGYALRANAANPELITHLEALPGAGDAYLEPHLVAGENWDIHLAFDANIRLPDDLSGALQLKCHAANHQRKLGLQSVHWDGWSAQRQNDTLLLRNAAGGQIKLAWEPHLTLQLNDIIFDNADDVLMHLQARTPAAASVISQGADGAAQAEPLLSRQVRADDPCVPSTSSAGRPPAKKFRPAQVAVSQLPKRADHSYDLSGRLLSTLDFKTGIPVINGMTSLPGTSFRGADVSGLSLDHIDLSRSDMSATKMGGISADQARQTIAAAPMPQGLSLNQVNLDSVTASQALLPNSFFTDVSMKGIQIESSVLTNSFLKDCDINHAAIIESDFTDGNFVNVNAATTVRFFKNIWTRVQVRRCTWVNAEMNFLNAPSLIVTESSMPGVQLENSQLPNSRYFQSNMAGGNFRKADMKRARVIDCNFDGVDLERGDWNGVEVRGTRLTAANMNLIQANRANFNGAIMNEAKMTGGSFYMSQFAGTQLAGADYTGADLTSTNFDSANLSGAPMANAILLNANCVKANMVNADLTDALMTGARLQEADLSGAQLINIKIGNTPVSFYGAKLDGATISFNLAALTDPSAAGLGIIGPVLHSISTIDPKYVELKTSLMLGFMTQFSAINPEFVAPGMHHMISKYVLGHESMYLRDARISPLIFSAIMPFYVKQFGTDATIYNQQFIVERPALFAALGTHVGRLLKSPGPQNQAGVFMNSALINHMIYQAAHFAGTRYNPLVKRGQDIEADYLNFAPAQALKIIVDNDGAYIDDHVMMIFSRDGAGAAVMSRDTYGRVYDNAPDDVQAWTPVTYYKKEVLPPDGSLAADVPQIPRLTFVAQPSSGIGDYLSGIPWMANNYGIFKGRGPVKNLIGALHFPETVANAAITASGLRMFTDKNALTQEFALSDAMKNYLEHPFLRSNLLESEANAQIPNPRVRVSQEMVNQVLTALGGLFDPSSAREQAMALFSVSVFLTKLSSKTMLGTSDDSPLTLRLLATGFLNRAIELDAAIYGRPPQPAASWQEKLTAFNTPDTCTDLLSTAMYEAIMRNRDNRFSAGDRKIFEAIYPRAWNSISK